MTLNFQLVGFKKEKMAFVFSVSFTININGVANSDEELLTDQRSAVNRDSVHRLSFTFYWQKILVQFTDGDRGVRPSSWSSLTESE